ncbi:MAG: hypothetical protein KKF30_12505 [Proteobacteria bacterium]|nr:hypothetical protein [Pseudomonadota bacterium]MBU4472400.1 hypothetical protein [Pseudomonadota bacterium]MCG2750998.1 hypothetical protein [Desulfobacteraceae bacterium]
MKNNHIRRKLKISPDLVRKRSGPSCQLIFLFLVFLFIPWFAIADKPSSPSSDPVPGKEMDLRFQLQEIRLNAAFESQDQIIQWQKEKIEDLNQGREKAEKEISRINLANHQALERMRESTFRWIILLMMFMVILDVAVLVGGLRASKFFSGRNRGDLEKRLDALEKKPSQAATRGEVPPLDPKDDVLKTMAEKAMESRNWDIASTCWKELADLYPATGPFHFHLGYCLSMASDAKSPEDKKHLLNRSLEAFSRAGAASAEHLAGLNHWGNALCKQAGAGGQPEEKILSLFRRAEEKYQSVLALSPRHQETLYRLGVVLTHEARLEAQTDPAKAGLLFKRAGQTYEKLHGLRKNNAEVLNSWGICLSHQAKLLTEKDGAPSDGLLNQAMEKYEAAVAIKPDKHEAFYNWGNALSCQAKLFTRKDPAKAFRLFDLAGQKYAAAVGIKPDKHEAFYNWGNALSCQAKLRVQKDDELVLSLLGQACEKYKAACEACPGKNEALNNWGLALLDQAKIIQARHPEKAWKILMEAGEKFKAAFKPENMDEDLLNNWGNVLHLRAKIVFSRDRAIARKLLLRAGEKFRVAEKRNPRNPETKTSLGNVFSDLAKLNSGDKVAAFRLFSNAFEKYEEALELGPGLHEAFNHWGLGLSDQAQRMVVSEPGKAAELLALAGEKFQAALEIKPGKAAYLHRWGDALAARAKGMASFDAEKAREAFESAAGKYKPAHLADPNNYAILYQWGMARLSQGKLTRSTDPEKALEQWKDGQDKLIRCHALRPGFAAYDLARISALTQNSKDCRKWLETSKKTGRLPSFHRISKDSDLDFVKEEAWFKKLLDSLKTAVS